MTRLESRELSTFRQLQTRAPFRIQMRHVPQVRDVPSLLSWLDAYLSTVERVGAKLREEDRTRARAATVLAGLRNDLRNAVSTLDEIDAAIEAGELNPLPKIPNDDEPAGDELHVGPYGVGPMPHE